MAGRKFSYKKYVDITTKRKRKKRSSEVTADLKKDGNERLGNKNWGRKIWMKISDNFKE